jgi:two-component system NarL family sensor kinase
MVAFSHALMQGQETERKRIAMELHDSVLQKLRFLPGTEALSEEVRVLCGELLPPDFSLVSFADSLTDLSRLFTRQTGIDCVTKFGPELNEPDSTGISAEHLLHCYRIVQEALTNVRTHADAHKAILSARLEEGRALLICISDDGAGFNPQERRTKTGGIGCGMGWRSMRERAAILGAKLEFISEQGQGFMVRLEVPIAAPASEVKHE